MCTPLAFSKRQARAKSPLRGDVEGMDGPAGLRGPLAGAPRPRCWLPAMVPGPLYGFTTSRRRVGGGVPGRHPITRPFEPGTPSLLFLIVCFLPRTVLGVQLAAGHGRELVTSSEWQVAGPSFSRARIARRHIGLERPEYGAASVRVNIFQRRTKRQDRIGKLYPAGGPGYLLACARAPGLIGVKSSMKDPRIHAL